MKKILLALAFVALLVLITGCSGRSEAPLRISLYKDGELLMLDYQEYISGCLLGGDPTMGEEAMKAAAIAVNTDAIYRISRKAESGFPCADLTDSDGILPYISETQAREQFGSSCETYLKKAQQAASYGSSRVITYEGEPISVEICRISTGKTDIDSAKLYVRSVKATSDKKQEDYRSTAAFSADTVRRRLTELTGASGLPRNPEVWFENARYSDGGTLVEVRFGGCRLTGGQLMKAFDLRSTAIDVKFTEDRFLFTCKGVGENRGISLSYASQLDKKGFKAEEILNTFYNGIEIERVG